MKRADSRIKLLQDTPFFGGIRDDIVALILDLSPTVSVSEGDYFFRENDSADSMYVLLHGQVAVLKEWEDKEFLLRKLKVGDCFGEMALMDFLPRSAAVVAVEDSKAIQIKPPTMREVFAADIEQFTMIEMNMGREVCRRLRASDKLIFERNVEAEIKDNHVEFSSI